MIQEPTPVASIPRPPARRLALAALALAAAACGGPAPSATASSATTAARAAVASDLAPASADGPRARDLKHVFLIMMENHGTDEILGNVADAPFLNELAKSAAVATSYYGVTHPSLPNYLAAISGDFQGIWDDCKAGADVTCAPEEFVPGSGDATSALLLTSAEVASATATPHWFAGRNLVDQLEESGRTWKAYMQSIPSAGSEVEYAPVVAGSTVKLYAQKHDPFMYFSDIRSRPDRMARIVPADELDADLASGDVPDLVWLSPDQCHDMHGMSPAMAAAVGLPACGYPASGLDHGAIALGDAYLKDVVGKILASPAWAEGAALAIVWDEDDYSGYAGCCGSPVTAGGGVLGGARAPAMVLTSRGGAPLVSDHPYNHYSLLGTIQRLWGLGCLANTCAISDDDLMTPLFGRVDVDRRHGPRIADRVLLLSVDGLHAVDLARFVEANPASALAGLSRRGVTYTAARTSTPSDSFPGLLALVTGGTPRSTGVYYDDSYDRTLFPPGSACAGTPGTEVVYDETVDHDPSLLFSGGMNPDNLPLELDGGVCRPVRPHEFLKVNTIFEVVKEYGGRTAWSDKHPSYDLVNGPSGTGVDDLYTPEINSDIAKAPPASQSNGVDLAATLARCDGTNSLPVAKVQVYTDCLPAVEAYDDVKVRSILNEIRGLRSDGSAGPGVPTVFGMNFQAVSVGQKLPVGGYLDAKAAPSAVLRHALAHTDASIGEMVEALARRGLLERTLVVVTAKHGQSPIDFAELAMEGGGHAPDQSVQDPLGFVNLADPHVDSVTFTNPVPGSSGGTYATGGHLQTDDVGILWLQDQSASNVAGVVAELTLAATQKAIHADALPAGTIFPTSITSGPDLAAIFGDPTSSAATAAARAPSVFIQPNEGVIYSGSSKKIAEHGGGAPGDTEVALLVAGPWRHGFEIEAPVHTTQVAPTILEALGIPGGELQAVRMEGTRPLPMRPR